MVNYTFKDHRLKVTVVLGFDILCCTFLSLGAHHIFGQTILTFKNQFIFSDTVAWTT